MLCADGQADRALVDSLIGKLRFRQLRMRCGGRVDDQGFYISHVGKQGENLQRINEPEGLFSSLRPSLPLLFRP